MAHVEELKTNFGEVGQKVGFALPDVCQHSLSHLPNTYKTQALKLGLATGADALKALNRGFKSLRQLQISHLNAKSPFKQPRLVGSDGVFSCSRMAKNEVSLCHTTSYVKESATKPLWSFKLSSKRLTNCWLKLASFVAILALTASLCVPQAQAHPIDLAVIAQIESSGNPGAISPKGAAGMYGIMPITLKHYNQSHHTAITKKQLFDETVNRRVADWYFDWLEIQVSKISYSVEPDEYWYSTEINRNMILIAYNFGIGNLKKYLRGQVGLPEETKTYIKKYNERKKQ